MLMVAGPFIAGGVGVWNGAAQGDTTAPQALPGIENIANGKQLLDYVEEDPKAGEAMRRVLLKPDRSYRSIAEINRAAAADLKRFKAVQDAKVKMGAANDPDEIIDAAPDIEELRTALKNAVLDDDYSDADFPDVKTDEGKAALQGLVLNFPAEEEAAVLQKGWSLAVTMRLVNALEDGDVVPKGLDGQLVKSAGRRFPVLGQDHPLARRAAERVAKGLHPVGAPRRPR
jgi:hypothetical protein